jgi:hypothetical protein
MAEVSKATVIAAVEETTTGELIAPSSAAEFVPARPGAAVTAAFEVIESDELLNDIGASESTLGKETPTLAHPAYVKHSGVEGQEPEIGIIYESCLGAKTVNATEYSVTAGSVAGTSTTRGSLEMATNDEDNFEKGQAVLIKDGTNGYAVRNVYNVDSAGNQLDLSFNLDNAPASGVALGKAILYKPASSGHPSFSYWKYEGNAGGISAMAGSQTSTLGFSYTAGQNVELEINADGSSSYWNPIIIDATNDNIDITDDVGTIAVTLTSKAYKTPLDLADEITSKATAASVGSGDDTITCTYNSTDGKFTLASDGSTFSLLWQSGTNTATSVGTTIGFLVAADDTGSTSYEGDGAISLGAALTPTYDDVELIVAKNVELMIGTFDEQICREASAFSITVDRPNVDVDDFCSESGVAEKVPESRAVTGSATLTMKRYESALFDRLKDNESVTIAMNVGPKDGSGNWTAGKCVNLYIPQAKITAHNVTGDTFLQVELEFSAFVSSDQKDFYINFL